jgi:membrane protein DedA with SNARE-associated domain
LPLLPSEATVVLAGVLAWQGRLSIVAVGLAAAAGAIVGDHLSYGLGHWTSNGGFRRSGGKVARLQAWAAQQLHVRGPTILLVARFVPGGRTASTFMSGRLRFPLARFSGATCLTGPCGPRSPPPSATSVAPRSTTTRSWPPGSGSPLA